jgi:hypothetical protein
MDCSWYVFRDTILSQPLTASLRYSSLRRTTLIDSTRRSPTVPPDSTASSESGQASASLLNHFANVLTSRSQHVPRPYQVGTSTIRRVLAGQARQQRPYQVPKQAARRVCRQDRRILFCLYEGGLVSGMASTVTAYG